MNRLGLILIAASFVGIAWIIALAPRGGLDRPMPTLPGAPQPSAIAMPTSEQDPPADRAKGTSESGNPLPTVGPLPPALVSVTRQGDIAYAEQPGYVAIPIGPGHRIRICGPADCVDVTSTDAGPNHKMLVAGRIADLALRSTAGESWWERICGVPKRFGLCPGSWTLIGAAATLPATDR